MREKGGEGEENEIYKQNKQLLASLKFQGLQNEVEGGGRGIFLQGQIFIRDNNVKFTTMGVAFLKAKCSSRGWSLFSGLDYWTDLDLN